MNVVGDNRSCSFLLFIMILFPGIVIVLAGLALLGASLLMPSMESIYRLF